VNQLDDRQLDFRSYAFLNLIGQTPVTFSAKKVQVTTVAGYVSSDGSAGATTTVTTASLVGKTMTFKDGILTGFA